MTFIGRKDISMACSRGVGDHNVCNHPFDWKFNLLYDIVSKHSMDLDHVKTFMEDALMARFPTVPVECKTLLTIYKPQLILQRKNKKAG